MSGNRNKRLVESPDRKHVATLTYDGEIRFGPPFFRLSVDGVELPERVFGEHVLWSENSVFLAAEEWLTTDESTGPLTRACLIEVSNGRIATFETAHKGLIREFRFEQGRLHYQQCYHAAAGESRQEMTVDIGAIDSWCSMRCAANIQRRAERLGDMR